MLIPFLQPLRQDPLSFTAMPSHPTVELGLHSPSDGRLLQTLPSTLLLSLATNSDHIHHGTLAIQLPKAASAQVPGARISFLHQKVIESPFYTAYQCSEKRKGRPVAMDVLEASEHRLVLSISDAASAQVMLFACPLLCQVPADVAVQPVHVDLSVQFDYKKITGEATAVATVTELHFVPPVSCRPLLHPSSECVFLSLPLVSNVWRPLRLLSYELLLPLPAKILADPNSLTLASPLHPGDTLALAFCLSLPPLEVP